MEWTHDIFSNNFQVILFIDSIITKPTFRLIMALIFSMIWFLQRYITIRRNGIKKWLSV